MELMSFSTVFITSTTSNPSCLPSPPLMTHSETPSARQLYKEEESYREGEPRRSFAERKKVKKATAGMQTIVEKHEKLIRDNPWPLPDGSMNYVLPLVEFIDICTYLRSLETENKRMREAGENLCKACRQYIEHNEDWPKVLDAVKAYQKALSPLPQ